MPVLAPTPAPPPPIRPRAIPPKPSGSYAAAKPGTSSAAEAAVPEPVPVPPAAERPARQPPRESRSAPKAPPHPDDLDAKFNALRQNTERQARILTSKGDVKALLALRADTSKRYQQLGASRPEFLAEVLQALDAKIDEARAIRLRLDAEVFRR